LAQRLLAGLRAIPETAQRCQPEVFNARARLLEALAITAPEQAPAPNSSPPACESTSTPQSVRCVGLTLSQHGRDADAVRWLRAALNERSDDVEVRLTLARSLGRAGDDSAALALLEAHVIEQPLDARAWLNLGVAAARLGRIERAREAWSKVLRLDPGQTDAAALLKADPCAQAAHDARAERRRIAQAAVDVCFLLLDAGLPTEWLSTADALRRVPVLRPQACACAVIRPADRNKAM
jgi:predicted Zn-dependent protease